MSSKLDSQFSVYPMVLRADGKDKEITIHPRYEYARRLLDEAVRVRAFAQNTVLTSVGVLHTELPPAPVRRTENGDMIVTLNTPSEGEYSIILDNTDPDGTPVESIVFFVYALEEDLFALNFYKGDFHMHSCKSDGRYTPEYIAATCRKNGFDFMALTDHHDYEPSLIARKAMAELNCDMLVLPGEEVHLPDSPAHIVNFGGNWSINQLARCDEEKYRDEVAEYMKDLPDSCCELARFQIAAAEWTFDRIRESGGVAVFSHPFWRPRHHDYLGKEVIDQMFARRKFDAIEVVGGFNRQRAECNILSITRWQEETAKGGKPMPPVGVSDSHDCDGAYSNWYYTIVFSEKLDFDSIAAAIRDSRCVAVHDIPDTFPLICGSFRLTRFAYFLLREYFPGHNELCAIEGNILRRAVAGEEPDAAGYLASRSGSVSKYLENAKEK